MLTVGQSKKYLSPDAQGGGEFWPQIRPRGSKALFNFGFRTKALAALAGGGARP